MIKCISIDGADGVGKSTLISNLSEIYNVVTLQRFYMTGIVPVDPEERKLWFRDNDTIETTKLYIAGHKLRLNMAIEFKKGLNYKFLGDHKKQNLILIDRGALSVQAYSYAALKKGTDWNDDRINYFLETECDMETYSREIIDFSVLLFDKDSIEQVIARRKYDMDDEMLARYQHEYYCQKSLNNNDRVKIISPLKKEMEIVEEVNKIIERK